MSDSEKPNVTWECSMYPKHPPRQFIVKNGEFRLITGFGIFKEFINHEFPKDCTLLFTKLNNTTELEINKEYYIQNIEEDYFEISLDKEGKELVNIEEGTGMIVQKTGKFIAPFSTCMSFLASSGHPQALLRWTPLQKAPKIKEKDAEGNPTDTEKDDPDWKPIEFTHWKAGIDIEDGQLPYKDSEPYHPIIHPFQAIWVSLPKGMKIKDKDN